MTNHRWTRQVGIALSVVSVALLSGHCGWAEQCSNKTTEGRYMVIGDGYLSTGPNMPLVPAKLLSTVTADANGMYSGTGTITIGGQVFVEEVVGTQQLNSDCTGFISYKQTINGQPTPNINFIFVVSEHGNRIDGLSVDPGAVFSGVLRRLER
jgi:hypothetical protein